MSRKFLELYSANRDRHSYPFVSDFTVPFGAPLQNISPDEARDPIVDGPIYYTFTLTPPQLADYQGAIQPGSSTSTVLLDPNQTVSYSLLDDFYKGFTFTTVTEARLIRSYVASTGAITLDYPLASVTVGATYQMLAGFPNQATIFIPSLDDNGNVIQRGEQVYNGYYVVFETQNNLWSNADNSNIFSRRISYYDDATRIAYFDSPLPFDLSGVDTPLTFTLRKSLPSSRWVLSTPTYLSSQPAADPNIGPLPGCYIITMPPGASDVDNFYKGKYVYFANNQAEYYSPPLPNPKSQLVPIPYTFYPIYGSYYIKAYNGATRQLSVKPDPVIPNDFPTYSITAYTEASFVPGPGIASITSSLGEYTATFSSPPIVKDGSYEGRIELSPPDGFEVGTSYDITFRVRRSASITSMFFFVPGVVNYNSSTVLTTYVLFQFRVTATVPPFEIIFTADFDVMDPTPKQVIWDLFRMEQKDIINICTFRRDNFYPLDYSGTLVGLNQAVCYDISLVSLSMPNLPLLTGSKVAFYPFLYVELYNVTSPVGHSTNLFYSNHPESSRAMFTAAVYPAANPDQQQFMAISGSMNQSVKFKPNDSLHIRIYLPNGELFVPILQDLQSPYEPWVRLQVQALFAITRSTHTDK